MRLFINSIREYQRNDKSFSGMSFKFFALFATIQIAILINSVPFSAIAASRLSGQSQDQALQVHSIKPSLADNQVKNFDQPSYAFIGPKTAPQAPLVVFLPATGVFPSPSSVIGTFAAQLGFRSLVLEYNDEPSISQICPDDPNPKCSELFRLMRTTGDGEYGPEHNSVAESIETRLRSALALLDKQYPDENWGQYLSGTEPNWSRMVVSGLSQGAGMAAFLAHRHKVDRVVLFSSPWDVTGPDHHPAPWLSEPSATPQNRWFAEYHAREDTAAFISNAYKALQIPGDHIKVFRLDLPDRSNVSPDSNPFHSITTRDQRYAPQWKYMFGKPN